MRPRLPLSVIAMVFRSSVNIAPFFMHSACTHTPLRSWAPTVSDSKTRGA